MKRSIFFDHDGGIDDFLALLLLLTYQHLRLTGVSVTPADTYIEAALPATRKLLDLGGRSEVVVGAGTLEGTHPFPHLFRVDSFKVDAMPILNQRAELRAPLSPLSGQELLAQTLIEAPQPVTLVMTGPLSNLAWALDHHPEVEPKVEELVAMGGALEVPGNVQEHGHDGSAEWNIYWDPGAAKRVFESTIPITLFPLDATDQVPVTEEFRLAIGRQYRYPLSAAAGYLWALTAGYDYYCWDTLTVSYLARPELCTFRQVRCEVITEGPGSGRTLITKEGRIVKAAQHVEAEAFYSHCLDTLRR